MTDTDRITWDGDTYPYVWSKENKAIDWLDKLSDNERHILAMRCSLAVHDGIYEVPLGKFSITLHNPRPSGRLVSRKMVVDWIERLEKNEVKID